MKNSLICLMLIMVISSKVLGQIEVPQCHISIVNSDSIVWVEKCKTVVICHSTGKRESIALGKSNSSVNLNTTQFKITESKGLISGEVHRVYLSSRYFSFVSIDALNSSFHIFKKRRNTPFSKKYWEEITPPLILPPTQSLLFGPYSDVSLNIINKISFIDVFAIKVYYTNGKSESFTFDSKKNSF